MTYGRSLLPPSSIPLSHAFVAGVGTGRDHSRVDLPGGDKRSGVFIALEGVDGTGKTTLAARVAEMLTPQFDARFQRRQYVPPSPLPVTRTMNDLARLLWDRGDCSGDDQLPSSFWLHAQAAWHAASRRHAVAPELERRDALIVDGWYYKFFAKMLLLDHPQEQLEWAFADAGEPDLVILIDRDPSEGWDRRGTFNKSEMGLHQGYSDLGRASFLSYQRDVLARFRELADRRSWVTYQPRPGASIDEDAGWLADAITNWLAVSCPCEARPPPRGEDLPISALRGPGDLSSFHVSTNHD